MDILLDLQDSLGELNALLSSACFMVLAALALIAFVMIREIFRATHRGSRFYCNKCGYYGKTSRHEGCDYIAAKTFHYDE